MKKFGFENSTQLVDDWWELFEFPNNPAFKDLLVEMIRKYPDSVVRKASKPIMMGLKHKYLPTLQNIQNKLDDEYGSMKRENNTKDLLMDLAKNENDEDGNQRVYFNMIVNNLKEVQSGQMSLEEYYEIQANWFDAKGMKEDADFVREHIKRKKEGKDSLPMEEYDE